MTVSELISLLQAVPGTSRVWMGYDGNIVVTEPAEVECLANDLAIGDCWWEVYPGDTVILCRK